MIDEKFKNDVATHNYSAVRNAIRICLMVDHNVTYGRFNEYWVECKNANIIEQLYQPHDKRILDEDLNENNYAILGGQLSMNFSKERLECLLNIARKLWPDEQIPKPQVSTSNPKKSAMSSRQKSLGKKTKINKSHIRIETEHASGRELQQTSNRRTIGKYAEKSKKNTKRSGYFNKRTKSTTAKTGIVVAITAIVVIGLLLFLLTGRN